MSGEKIITMLPAAAKKAKSRPSIADVEEGGHKLTWTRKGISVAFKPDGRKCKLCTHKDSDQDPVSKATVHTPHFLTCLFMESRPFLIDKLIFA